MGQEGDPPVEPLVAHESVEPDHHLHVLAHRSRVGPYILLDDPVPHERRQVSAGPDQDRLLEDGEDAAQDQHRLQPVEAGAAGGERPEIFHHLESGEGARRQSHLDDPAPLDRAPIRDRDLSAHRDHTRVFLDHPHQFLERVLVEDRVGIERETT